MVSGNSRSNKRTTSASNESKTSKETSNFVDEKTFSDQEISNIFLEARLVVKPIVQREQANEVIDKETIFFKLGE